MKKMIIFVLCAVMLLGMLAGCSTDSTNGKLILATSADYPPFEFHMLDENGKDVIVGIDVSVAKKIAEDMGKELEIVDITFDNLLTAMDKGQCDIVIAAMEENAERDLVADFSDPYYTDYPPMVLVKADKAAEYTSLESFSGKSVGAQTATTKEDIVKNDMAGANLVSLQLVTDLVNQLVNDKLDAIVLDGAVALQYAESNADLVVAECDLGEAYPYCVAVAKGDPKGLLPGINEAIADMLANDKVTEFIAEADALGDVAVEVTAE